MSHAPTAALVIAVLAFVGFAFVTLTSEWKRSSKIDTQDHLNTLYSCEGLWVRCTTLEVGKFSCDSYETNIIGLPAHITGLRAMMILSLITGTVSLALITMGLRCVHAAKGKKKRTMCQVGGFFHLIATLCNHILAPCPFFTLFPEEYQTTPQFLDKKIGCLCLAAVSWYAYIVIQEYYYSKNINSAQIFYEFGAGIYVGWVAGGLGIIAAIMAFCGAPRDEEQDDYRYDYQPSKKKASNTEYV